MAKLILDNVTNLENQGSTVSTINNNSDLIEAAIENTVSRSGLSPNQMAAQLDMNNNKIINLPSALSGGDAVSLDQLNTSMTASTVRFDIPQNLNPIQQQQARDNINVDTSGGSGTGGVGNITSVFGRYGVVTAQTGDYSVDQVTGAAPTVSPVFTGVPAAPTAAVGNNTTQLATTAFVLANVGSGAVPSVFGRTGSVTAASGDYSAGQITNVPAGGIGSLTVQSALNELDLEKANIASPTFTTSAMAPTPSPGSNNTNIATTAFVQAAIGASFKNITIQRFIASGTYTPTAGMLFAIIECVGGGGGGGTVALNAGTAGSGGGGGGGAYSRKRVTAADIGVSKVVTIGAAGAGGPGGTNSNGSQGGTTSVGTLCIADGGRGGGFSNIALQVPFGGSGGFATLGTGDFTSNGSPGSSGLYNSLNANVVLAGTIGGSSYFGGGATSALFGQIGANATNYGGGGGGPSANSAVALAGGNGKEGVVLITEFS